MTERATKRPRGFTKPAHWTNEPPPEPARPTPEKDADANDPDGLSPTRYRDWTSKGIAIDF